MNKRFTKAVAATLAAMSIANVAVFADDTPVVEEAPSKITVDIETLKAEGEILNTFGDINLDGEVTNADLLLCAKAVIGAEKLEGYSYIIADANKDGLVTNPDLVDLSRALVGLDYKKAELRDQFTLDCFFPDYEKMGKDFKGGTLAVFMKSEVDINFCNRKLKSEDIQKLLPGVELKEVDGPTFIHSMVYFRLKDDSKETALETIYKLKYNPYIIRVIAEVITPPQESANVN